MKKYIEYKNGYKLRGGKKDEYLFRRLYPELVDFIPDYY